MTQPLLDLATLDRPQISIDKRGYDVMRPDDFGIRELLKLHKLRDQVARVQATAPEDLTEAALEEMADALDTMVRMIMPDLPAEVFAKLYDTQKLQIVAAFSTLVGWNGAPRPGMASPSTGASGSRG